MLREVWMNTLETNGYIKSLSEKRSYKILNGKIF